jgi:DNA end-binding protein Ku
MARAIWSGVLEFVLVSFPAKLYKSTDSKGVSFKTLHNMCGTNIKLRKWCETCGREVQPNEIEKGYEIAKGQYVIFNEEEIENALPESNKIIKIEKAVTSDEIPLITYEDSYFLVPDKGGEHVYNLLFNALSIKPKVLIGRVTLRSKEHLVAIRPYSDGLLLSMLHFIDDVRDIHEVVVIKDKRVDKKELDLAVTLMDSLTGPFKDIYQKDHYREEIEKIAAMKATGQVVKIEQKKSVKTTGDLVEALRKSLEMSKGLIKVPAGQVSESRPVEPELVQMPISKKELDKAYGITEEEINKTILEQSIEETQERINILKELKSFKSFEEYVKSHKDEIEGIEVGQDFRSITIEDDKYPRIKLPILKKIGIVAEHFGVLIYIGSSKKQVVPKIKEEDILKLDF